MRLLIAVTSYFPDAQRGCHEAIRQGWGKDVSAAGADLRFFTPYPHFIDPPEWGTTYHTKGYEKQPDEVWLEMNGLYTNISFQVQKILKYSLENNYDFVMVCANDTYIKPKALFAPGFEGYDWSGLYDQRNRDIPFGETFDWYWYEKKIPSLYGWMGGGPGMTFSRKASEIIVSEDLNPWIAKNDFWGFGYDSLFGQILGPHFKTRYLRARNDDSFSYHYQHSPGEQRYAGVCQWQRDMYDKHKEPR